MDDDGFRAIFKSVMQNVMDTYRPGAVVLQCGADSLAADRLGCFNLSLDGHADCVKFMKTFKVPLLVTGAGYTKSNVARCWTYETAALLDREISADIPEHDFYYEYYADVEYKMKVQPTNYIENLNTKSYLQDIQQKVLENLRALEHAPGVAMHEVPPDSMLPEFDEDDLNCDERNGGETEATREFSATTSFTTATATRTGSFVIATKFVLSLKRRSRYKPNSASTALALSRISAPASAPRASRRRTRPGSSRRSRPRRAASPVTDDANARNNRKAHRRAPSFRRFDAFRRGGASRAAALSTHHPFSGDVNRNSRVHEAAPQKRRVHPRGTLRPEPRARRRRPRARSLAVAGAQRRRERARVSRFSAKGFVSKKSPATSRASTPPRTETRRRRFCDGDGARAARHAEPGGVRLGDRGGALGSAREAEPRGGGVSSALGQDARLRRRLVVRRRRNVVDVPLTSFRLGKLSPETKRKRKDASPRAVRLSRRRLERGIARASASITPAARMGAWHAASPASAAASRADSAAARAGSIVATTTPEVSSGASLTSPGARARRSCVSGLRPCLSARNTRASATSAARARGALARSARHRVARYVDERDPRRSSLSLADALSLRARTASSD